MKLGEKIGLSLARAFNIGGIKTREHNEKMNRMWEALQDEPPAYGESYYRPEDLEEYIFLEGKGAIPKGTVEKMRSGEIRPEGAEGMTPAEWDHHKWREINGINNRETQIEPQDVRDMDFFEFIGKAPEGSAQRTLEKFNEQKQRFTGSAAPESKTLFEYTEREIEVNLANGIRDLDRGQEDGLALNPKNTEDLLRESECAASLPVQRDQKTPISQTIRNPQALG